MLSKNNRHLQEQRMSDSKQRFSIRKYSFGAASVLLGLSFMTYAGGNPVSADTTDQPAVTVTEPKTTASTAQKTAASEASSTATSEAAKQTSEAVSSTATSESAAAETTQSSETASKETVTSEAAKESTAPSEASKISTATSEASEKASTAATESSTPATATSEESSQEQTTSSETGVTVDTNALTAFKVAKTSALKSVKLAALKSVKLAAVTTTTSTDDVASAKEGKITDEGKAKDLTDSDVTPGMSDANDAKLEINNSKIPDGYVADPTEGRYTFGILSLGPVTSEGMTSYNTTYGTNYYIRLSTSAKATDGTYDNTVYIQLVDKDTGTVIKEYTAKPGDVNQTIDKLNSTNDQPFQYSYNEKTSNGVTTRTITFNASPNNTGKNGKMYSAKIYESGSTQRAEATLVTFNYPDASTLKTRYIAKDAAGNETVLAEYNETGRPGYTYTISGKRSFAGYDLVSSPKTNTGTLQAGYKVGQLQVFSPRNISNYLQIVRTQLITNTDGTAIISYRLAKIGASTDDINNPDVWKVVYESEELKPGEMSNTGNSASSYLGVSSTRGGFAIDPSYNAAQAEKDKAAAEAKGETIYVDPSIDPNNPEYDAKYAFKGGLAFKKTGFTIDQLDGWNGKVINYTLYNINPEGQKPVDYYYAPQGQVRVNYVTSDGKVLQAPTAAYENSSAGTPYNAANYRPATITVDGKTYHYVESDKNLGTPGTTKINGYTYNVTPSDETGTISSNTVSDVYYVYKLLTYHTEEETKDVTRTIEYYDSVTNKPIPDSLEKTVTQTATLKRNKIYDDQNHFIGYGTISADGSSYTLDDGWTVDAQTWTQQDSADLSGYGYTAPDRPSVAAVTVDGNTTTVTEMVRYGHQTQTITPNDPTPVTPGDPINPNDPNSPVYSSETDRKNLVKDASQTVHYVGAGDKTPTDNVVTQKDAFTRTVTIDKVTGKVLSYTDWTGKKTFDTVNTPVIDGYHADKKVAGGLTATVDNPDVEATVTYSPNGKIVPVDPNGNPIPGADTPTYKNDPDDPTKVVPNEPIPDVPNWTPVDPSPVTPTNPGENTSVPYYQVSGTIKYVDDTTKQTLSSEDLQKGKVGSKIDYITADKIKAYVDQGYELVSNDFTDGSQIYKASGNNFTVHLKHATQTITPNDPTPVTPGDPINPNDPNSPVYSSETDRKNLVKDASQTIYYVGAGDKTPADNVVTQKDAFTRTVTIDKVTGKVLSYTNWTGEKAFDPVDTPVVDGYHADKKTAGGLTATVDNPDVKATVTYTPNGKLIPVDEEGKQIPGTDTPTYKTDPNDPTKVVDPTVPNVDGYTPKNNKVGDKVTPEDPSKDTEVPYAQVVTGTIKYVDDVTGQTLRSENLEKGTVGSKIDYTTADKIEGYKAKGYDLVSNDFTDGNQTYAKTGNDFTVHLTHQTIPVTPGDPKNPGDPIIPGGNVTYPEGLTEKDLKDTVTRTIEYVDPKDNPVNGSPDGKSSYVQSVTFERTAIVDKVTGKLLGYDTNNDGKVDTDNAERAWTPLSADLAEVKSTDPKTLGFDHVDKNTVAKETVVPGQADLNEKVVYSNNPMVVSGTIKYVDDTTGVTLDEDAMPSGEVGSKINYTTADKITYYENKGYELVSNDFKDGTTTYAKEGNNFEVHLKHKTQTITPNDPNPVAPGNPINPKDPNSPVYGEETDRKNLVKDATQTIHYVGAGDKTPADKKQTQKEAFTRTVTIDKVTGKVLETSAWEGTKTFGFEDTPFVEGYHANKKSEGGLTATPDNPDVEATVTYTPNGKLIPVDEEGKQIPGTDTPTYKTDPNDPTKVVDPTVPEVEGYQPRDNKVGDKVTPKDPAKDTEVVYVKTPETKYGLTEKFVDVDGNELSPNESKGSDYKTGDSYDVTKDAKVINGYVLVDTDETTGTFDKSDKTATFIYKKVGKIIPVDKDNNPIPGADTPSYKNDPDDPTKVTPNEPTPTVPGWTPNVPNVTPEDPTKDKPVIYTQDKYGLTEKFVDVDGNELSPTESKGTEYKTGDKYDVTKDAKVITGYVLVDTDQTTGTFAKSDKTATFIYKKVGKIIPVDKDNNPIPGADTPSYKNDPDDPTKVTPNEPTPGVPGWKTDVPNVTPEDPTKDKPVPYTKNETPETKYGLLEKFVDEEGNELAESVDKGSDYKTGDTYDVTKDAKVITGYVLVKTEGTTGTFTDSGKLAVFTYKKVGKIVPVDPNGNPIPGADTPTYENDPDNPTKVTPNEPTPTVPGWTTDVPNVTPEDPTKDTPVVYTQDKYGLTEKFVDEEGNELLPSESKGSDYKTGDTYDVTKDAKVITGYVLVKTEGTTGTFEKSDKTAVFTYKKIGKIVPVDPNGNPIPGADTPTYENDPDDPSKVVPNEPTPGVPGYKTDVPNVTPEDPTKDTPVVYTQDKYGLTEKFVDEEGNELLPSESKGSDYKTGDTYDVTKDAKVITGYVLVKTEGTTGTFEKSDKTAVFTYKKLGKIVPVDPNGNPIPGADTPTYKNDPDDPSKVVPNEPTPSVPGYKTNVPNVTPEDPTKDTPVPYTKNETPAAKYGLTEKFVDENGNDLVPSESKGTDYKSGDKYDVTKDAKVITGYVLVKTTDTTGTFTDGNKTAVFTYKKLGKIVPVDPNGNPIPGVDTPTYKNDPDDPSKVVPNEPTPTVPGYKTDVPKVTPEDPTKDTPVPYTKNETPAAKYGLTEKFVDENGNDLVPSESKGTDYKSGDKYDVTKDAKVITGYVLVKTTDTTGTFTDGNKTAVFTYKKIGKIVPVDKDGNPIPSADTPTYKNDPDDPSKVVPNEPTPTVPGYKTNVPNVTPEDPTKDTPVPYTKNETPAAKYGLTEKFVDENGNDLVPSESKGTDYKSGDKYDVTKDAKVITGYVLVKTTDTTGTFTDGNKTAVFTYKKLGKIIPVDPKGNPIPGADTPTYKNDPDDPSKVVPNEPTPSVPGYKTDVPNVTPEDPTKDTPVPFTKNETPAAKYGLTEKFVDENGNDLVPSESKGADYKSGDKYDVTKDAKVITGYVLVKTTDTTGTFGDSDKTAVFTYKKIGKIIPVDKDGNPIPGAETPSYKNDPSDPSKVLPNEPTPDVLGYKTDVPSVTPEDPTKDTPVPYTKSVTPSKPSNNKPGKKGAPSAPTGPTSPTLPGGKKGKTAPATPNATAFSTGSSKQTASLKQNAQAKLPQTGEATDKSRALSVLGLGVIALTALLGLAIDKKRKN